MDEVVKKKFDKIKVIAIVLTVVLAIGIFGIIECVAGFGDDTYIVVDTGFNNDMGVVLWSPRSESPHGLVTIDYIDEFTCLGERVKLNEDLKYGCNIGTVQTTDLKFRGISTLISLLVGKYTWHRYINNGFDVV